MKNVSIYRLLKILPRLQSIKESIIKTITSIDKTVLLNNYNVCSQYSDYTEDNIIL